MHALSPQALLRVWETGRRQDPVDRAVTILLHASGGESASALSSLTIGERDHRVLEVREKTFGRTLDAYAECSSCSERLELRLTTDAIRSAGGAVTAVMSDHVWIDGVELSLRMPDSNDLRALRGCDDLDSAHARLVELCIDATLDGERVAAGMLPADVVARAATHIAGLDPRAEVLLDLGCPTCKGSQQLVLDIAAFFWSEIAAQAKRLLREIHVLARAYSWREADILAMSPWRRECYLAMVEG